MTHPATDDPTAAGDEHAQLTALLADAEQRAARLPELERRIDDLEHDVDRSRQELVKARREIWELDQLLMYSRRLLRFVRPLVGPLRQAKRRLRS
jgi:chromosome segregation ATPase